jgi:hypothetical protein
MVNKSALCNKISAIYPELGSCDQALAVNWDETNHAWAVDFELKGEKIRHYLEDSDASACMLNGQCVGMGIEFGQFL